MEVGWKADQQYPTQERPKKWALTSRMDRRALTSRMWRTVAWACKKAIARDIALTSRMDAAVGCPKLLQSIVCWGLRRPRNYLMWRQEGCCVGHTQLAMMGIH